jgi:hypothetical protein
MLTKLHPLLTLTFLLASGTAFADEVRGVIVKVDTERHELVVQVQGRALRGLPMTFRIGKDIPVIIGREPADLPALQPGERVRVLYESRDGERVAVGVTVRGPLHQPAAAPAPVPADPNTIIGVLSRVAFIDREIVVLAPGPDGKPAETTIAVPETAKITKGKEPLKFDDLKEGEKVAVRTDKHDGTLTAAAIDIGPLLPPPGSDKNARIDRLRQFLRFADYYLQQMKDKKRDDGD